MPIRGFCISSSVIPSAWRRERWGAHCTPHLTASLFTGNHPFLFTIVAYYSSTFRSRMQVLSATKMSCTRQLIFPYFFLLLLMIKYTIPATARMPMTPAKIQTVMLLSLAVRGVLTLTAPALTQPQTAATSAAKAAERILYSFIFITSLSDNNNIPYFGQAFKPFHKNISYTLSGYHTSP